MLNLIKKAIGIQDRADFDIIQDERKAVPSLSKNHRKVELLASLFLLEAAHADFECTEKELDHVVETVKSMFNLPHEYVEELLEFAHSERGQVGGLYEFTRQANEQMSKDEKRALLEAIWEIIYADGQIDKHEEHFARKLTSLLFLEHRDFIDAKLKVKYR